MKNFTISYYYESDETKTEPAPEKKKPRLYNIGTFVPFVRILDDAPFVVPVKLACG